ncbi:hypothetical protein [Celeribacter sp. PS-C1]|uniref:hypothetical protein n=1 Tax=Celeribacter sp. PS-C1 TaxID=2820813 RepID=UPI001CA4FD15|nr:hypothetical protein [Celeribacter sp. PS-C1]MBW6419366.1 hypothetical protein [Celeribacter sp. PS-C1]
MRRIRLCGYDVNGVRDMSARNWMILPGDEEVFDSSFLSHGDRFGGVVRVGAEAGVNWIGGRQAALAPHGRGNGWGKVGAEGLRVPILDLLHGRTDDAIALGSAFTGLVSGARFNAVAIDEIAEDVEIYQERLLAALSAERISNPMLVWRSVLAVLHHMRNTQVRERSVIGVVSHGFDGLRLQKLRILKQAGNAKEVLAPERRRTAIHVPFTLSYRQLVSSARERLLGGEALSARNAHMAQARSAANLALGETCEAEVLRKSNGDWDVLRAQAPLDLEIPKLPHKEFDWLSDCDEILFESLTTGDVRRTVLSACEHAIGRKITALPQEAVALGALEAAKRVSEGDPVFFDFLPKISTIVYADGEAASYDLIEDSETLVAGQLYRSPKPARLGLPGGQSEISIYLRKEAQTWPRKATVSIGASLKDDTPVSLYVEQKPAAGRARIVMHADTISHQFVVDWDLAEEIKMDWDALIASLEVQKPSIPNKLVLPCSSLAWDESNRGPSLYELLEQNVDRHRVDWASLAVKLASRPNQTYCISSEGALPTEVSDEAEMQLNRLTERAIAETRERLSGRRDDDNEALKFLTWQFKRAPDEVADYLLECISARDLRMFKHPFVMNHMSWVLVYYGAGRIISDPDRERKLMDAIYSRPWQEWNWRVEVAALAVLLSRSDSAPLFLTPERVEIAFLRLRHELKEAIGSAYTKFSYTPFLLVGLLRYRMKEPWALVLGRDQKAAVLAEDVKAVLKDLERRARRNEKIKRTYEKRASQLSQVLEELEGSGTNPDLLLDLFHST